MKHLLYYFIALLIFIPKAGLAAPEEQNDDWRFQLNPLYVWFVSLDGSTSMPPSDGGTGGSTVFDDSEISGAFSFHFEVGKKKWTLFSDYLYTEFTNENASISTSPLQGNNVTTVHIAELGSTYRVVERPRYLLEVLAGVRYLYFSNKFTFNNNALSAIGADTNVWDGFGGLRFTGKLTDSISTTIRADAGAGTSELVWNLIATVDWQFQKWASLYAGYRVLDYQLNDQQLDLNLQGKGPVVGFGFSW